ncbi:hypothetical protein ACIRP0_15245 [Streptomyces sp. NPDC101733]|uniref:hypothetical protein n=1 Tax=unclassified Streptomyces TaxID=2593676 RepID=UPI003812AE0F
MTPSPRLLALVLVPLLCALTAIGGCAAPGGLSQGEPAAPMSAQPHPEALWPAWAGGSPQAPGAATGTRQAPPTRLEGAPAVGRGGLTAVNYLDVVRADKRMRQYVAKGRISAPGGAGIRPAVYLDVTGDGKKDLIVAADTRAAAPR